MPEKLNLLKKALGSCWTNNEEHLFHCPRCSHHKRKLSVNIERDVFKCWICDYSGTKISQLIKKYAPGYYADWKQLRGEVDLSEYENLFGPPQHKIDVPVDLPDNFQTLTGKKTKVKQKALNYLYDRGITDQDILFWRMGFSDYGEYKGRIIIPSFDTTGKLDYFIARSYTEDWMKYKNPKVSKDIIFNDLNIDWSKDIMLVEGVFDAIKCDNAIPLLGSTLKETSTLFRKICNLRPNVYLALDTDAKDKEFAIAKKLKEYGIVARTVPVFPYNDVGEMSKQTVKLQKQKALIVNDLDFLENSIKFHI